MSRRTSGAALAALTAAVLTVASPADSATKRVPSVVGMNHQEAQDFLQSRGFYNLRERDCSGRGRALVWDRNWKVVRQTPAAGSRRNTNVPVTLCSVKYTD